VTLQHTFLEQLPRIDVDLHTRLPIPVCRQRVDSKGQEDVFWCTPICWGGKSFGSERLESGQVENFIAGFGCALDFDVESQQLRLPGLLPLETSHFSDV
jgi:hypothetical protein